MEFTSWISATLRFANKHYLGRKLRRSWFVSYVYRFKLTVHNLRTKLRHFSKEHRRMELANKHQLGRMPRLPWLVSYALYS